ncbi:MAG: tryptophan 7-halogenase [Planctomycetia bacterium]|nr:tryptophan 7-halogenase [Planctomycetia bacterium]
MLESFDCVVIGGGPAGCTAAALAAQGGLATLLVDREPAPRAGRGELLLPEAHATLKRLGVLDALQAANFPRSDGVRFLRSTGRETASFCFADVSPGEEHAAWHVLVGHFDQRLWDNAAARGAVCRRPARVLDVVFEGQAVKGVRVQIADEPPREIAARVVVDASGPQAIVPTQLGLRRERAGARRVAIWSHYRGARVEPGNEGRAAIVFHTQSGRSWFWFVPLPEGLASVGLVAAAEVLGGKTRPEAVFEEELCRCPAVLERLMNAHLVGDLQVRRPDGMEAAQPAGPGWIAVGQAAGPLDDLLFAGAFLAMKSAEMAADCAVAAVREGDTSAARLGRWAPAYHRGENRLRCLADAFFREGFSFGQFLRDFPHHRRPLTELLMGRAFGDGAAMDELLADLATWRQRARGDEEA